MSQLSPMIDAVIGLDPWVEPIGEEMLSEGLHQPAMFFRSTTWTGGINEDYIKILTSNECTFQHIRTPCRFELNIDNFWKAMNCLLHN